MELCKGDCKAIEEAADTLRMALGASMSVFGDALASATAALKIKTQSTPVEANMYNFRDSIVKLAPPTFRSWRLMSDWDKYIRNAPIPNTLPSGSGNGEYHTRDKNFGFGLSESNYMQEVLEAASTITTIQSNITSANNAPCTLDCSPEYINFLFAKQSRLLRDALITSSQLKEIWMASMEEMTRVSWQLQYTYIYY